MSKIEDWTETKIGKIARVVTGGTPRRDQPSYWGGTIPWVSTGLINFNTICQTEEHVTEAGVKNSSAKVFPAGTVLMAMFGQGVTRGKVATLGLDATFNQACVAIIPKLGGSSRFIYHFLEHNYQKLRQLSNSGSQDNLNAGLIKSFDILLPLPFEQEEIGKIGDCWNNAIRDTTQLIAAKTRLKRALMQQLLTGKRRLREFESSCFVRKSIGDVLAPTLRPVAWGENEIYRLASIRRNSAGLFWREALRGDQIKVKKLHTIREGDFLISHIQAAYGAMGCVPAEFDGGHISDMYSILTPKTPDSLDVRFVDYLSQMPQMRYQILQSSNGFFAERLRLNFDPREFLKQPITLPENLDEQRRICDVLDAATREIQLLQSQLAALREQKRGLMQKLLTGEVRVEVPS